jgi:threonine/homoserine/homoserine lactone efflux protein
MVAHLRAFLGVALVVILTPGPDTALVTKNALLYGRRAALGTALGVNAGLVAWTVASALGVAALVRASAVAFTTLKLIGGLYLIFLGVQALLAARRRSAGVSGVGIDREGRPISGLLGFRQGLVSNLANPKIAVFFTSLLPQFIGRGEPVLIPFLILGGAFVAITVIWLSSYAVLASTAAGVLQRPRVRATLDRLTGVVLIGLGIRIAAEHR